MTFPNDALGKRRISDELPIDFPIYAELLNTDVKPLPLAVPYEIDGELCWSVRIYSLNGLLELLDSSGGSLELTSNGAFRNHVCIVVPGVVDK